MATFFGGAGTGSFTIAGNFAYFFKAVCTASGNVTDGQAYYNSGGGNLKLAVYADSGGTPGAKLGESGVIALSGSPGMKTTTFATPFAVTNGTTYWLSWLSNSGPILGADDPGLNAFRFLASTYPNFPSSGSGSSTSSTQRGGLQVGVTSAGGVFVPKVVIM